MKVFKVCDDSSIPEVEGLLREALARNNMQLSERDYQISKLKGEIEILTKENEALNDKIRDFIRGY